jgi:hypothetical protein
LFLQIRAGSWSGRAALSVLYLIEHQVGAGVEALALSSQILTCSTITFFLSLLHVTSVTLLLPNIVSRLLGNSAPAQSPSLPPPHTHSSTHPNSNYALLPKEFGAESWAREDRIETQRLLSPHSDIS